MTRPRLRAPLDFGAIRAEAGVVEPFPPDALPAEPSDPTPRTDALDVPFVTIDPPGSLDLDQALHVERRAGGGFRVRYAIADLASFVVPDSPLDRAVWARGVTYYAPDRATPLHPPALSEGAASLLPDADRPAVLWTIDLDASGERTAVEVHRATVRSRARLDYAGVQADIDAGRPHPALAALAEVGTLRRARAVARGAIELELPDQEVVPDGAGGWTTRIRQRPPVETWNAEMSLLTGTAAASIMLDAGVGVLRTLPAPEPSAVEQLKRTAATLGIAWPDGATAAQVLSGLPLDTGPALALRRAASTLLRGAGYAAFDRSAGTAPPADPGHGGIGAPYAHVTAPLRRLVDRFGTEVCLALTAGVALPEWLAAALPTLPPVMAESDALAAKVERACVDRTEAALLASRVGAEFDAVVLRASGPENEPGEVFVAEPPVLARCTGVPRAGEVVRVELVEADPTTGRITFRAE